MNRRLVVVLAVAAGLLLAFAAGNLRFSVWTEPNVRAVEQRAPLSEAERANIEMFERVSPSVVQVAAQSAANPLSEETAQFALALRREDGGLNTVKVFACDMAQGNVPTAPKERGYWIQLSAQLKNPWWGAEMLECGAEIKP